MKEYNWLKNDDYQWLGVYPSLQTYSLLFHIAQCTYSKFKGPIFKGTEFLPQTQIF